MIFNPNIPNPADKLSASQPVLKSNNSDLDTTFGKDHYKFSDATANNGKHNKVTNPTYAEVPATNLPPTTTADPILYAFQVPNPPATSNVGVMHFSRGPNNKLPTPLTNIQSTSADSVFTAGQVKPILDFSGITRASCIVTLDFLDPTTPRNLTASVTFAHNKLAFRYFNTIGPLGLTISGTTLNIRSGLASSNVYWTVNFMRLE